MMKKVWVYLRLFLNIQQVLATGLLFAMIIFFPVYFNIDYLDPIQNTFQDFNVADVVMSKIRDQKKIKVDSNIILVNIGYLTRDKIAEEIEIINSYEPKVIGIDSFFRKLKGEKVDKPLADALLKVKNLVIAEKIVYNSKKEINDSIITSNPIFTKNAKFGFANLITEKESEERLTKTVRSFTPKQMVNNKERIFFAINIARLFNPDMVKEIYERDNEIELINFKRNYNKYLTLDYDDIFNRRDSLDFIRNKIVLIGFLGSELNTTVNEDIFFTPLNDKYIGKSLPDMYGLVVHANIISMMNEGSFIDTMPDWFNYSLIVLIIYLTMGFFTFLRVHYEVWYEPISIITVFASMFSNLMIITFLFMVFDLYLDLKALFFALLLLVPLYEVYFDSITPLFTSLMKRIKSWVIK